MREHRFDARTRPLIVGRVAALPIQVAIDLLAARNPFEQMRDLIESDPTVRQLLYVASRSLYDDLLRSAPPSDVKDTDEAWLRGMCYLLRSSGRSTPLGLCAGFGSVEPSDETSLTLSGWRTRTLPDMHQATELAAAVAANHRERIRVVTNGACLTRGDRFYITNINLSARRIRPFGTVTTQRPISIKSTPAVRLAQETCSTPVQIGELAETIIRHLGTSRHETEQFIDSLIDAGVLITELSVSPIGDAPGELVRRLERIAPHNDLSRAAAACQCLDSTDLTQRKIRDYEAIASLLGVRSKSGTTFHVDLVAQLQGGLGHGVLAEVEKLCGFLDALSLPQSLKTYRDRFVRFYESAERMVPLLELVDDQLGIGAPDRLDVEGDADEARIGEMRSIAAEAMRAHAREVILTDEQVDRLFRRSSPTQRSSHDLSFFVAARSREAINAGEFTILPGFVFTDRAGKVFGRFASALDPNFQDRMADLVPQITEAEDDCITAELAFAPQGRVYNITCRPRLFGRELNIGIFDQSEPQPIQLSDVWVGLDGEKFFLWSKLHGRQLSLRESHAFLTIANTPNLCRFLSMMASQMDRRPRMFDWNGEWHRYTPRVRYGRIVLAVRTWRFDASELGADIERAVATLSRWKEDWDLPGLVNLTNGDNTLLIDLESVAAAPILLDQRKNAREFVFREFLPTPDDLWLRGQHGAHVVEFVAALIPHDQIPHGVRVRRPLLLQQRSRYGPGSEWTYLKLYMGSQAMEGFVSGPLLSAITALKTSGLIEQWFWLRYADPDGHIRVRACAAQAEPLLRDRLLSHAEDWLQQGYVRRVCVDTFDPEYERYGEPEELAKVLRFFCEDSELCARILASIRETQDDRITTAALTFNRLVINIGEDALVLSAFKDAARLGLNTRDRETLRRMNGEIESSPSSLGLALGKSERNIRLCDLLHMHCNRLGVDAAGERRVALLLRSAALGRNAQRRGRERSSPNAPFR
ncbi:MAG TPA: lantibiotic dehydratase [Candidatus Baltobacteraceae bacterium]|nr:lantibiotic dehydratase [Candidatus Baltobacteraceae bacterium]